MFKFIIICVLWTTINSQSIEWYSGRWLPVVMYSNKSTNKTIEWVGWHDKGWIGLWTGWLLEPTECGWLEINSTNQTCTCGDRKDVPLMQFKDFTNLTTQQSYEFHLNESRPIIVINSTDEVKAGISEKCMCGDKEMTQLLFRRTSNNYLITYENKERTETGLNMTLLMMRYVPTMLELQTVTKSPMRFLNMPYQEPTLMCDPTFFDDSAYVVGSSEDDSSFLTLGDLKNG